MTLTLFLGGNAVRLAAMEPTVGRSDDGSRNLSRLKCVNRWSCERFGFRGERGALYGLVKMRK
jgi:hypothetical protein